MSNVIRLFVKPRAIPGLIPVGARPWKMNANQSIQQRRTIVTDDSNDPSEPQSEKETKRSPSGEANWKSSLDNRVFRVENNLAQVSKDIARIYKEIGEIKGQIGPMKWQLGVLLAIGLGGSGSLLLYLLKKHFDEPKNGSPGKAEMQEILKILESMKPTGSVKESIQKA